MLAGSRDLDDRGALLLAEAAGLRSDLALLDVRYSKISKHGLAALRERFGPAVAYGEYGIDDEDYVRPRQWR